MKKIFILFAILFFAVTVNAQWFIGGQLGLGIQNTRQKTEDIKDLDVNSINGSFLFGPYFGYCINDKWCVGLEVNVGTQFLIEGVKNKKHYNVVGWGVVPFAKYAAFTYKKFSLQLKGSIGVGGLHHFAKQEVDNKTTTIKGPQTIMIDVFNIVPILDFKLTDHWHLDAELSFLHLGYSIGFYKNTPDSKTTTTVHYFNCAFSSSNVLTMNCLKIGAYYKF